MCDLEHRHRVAALCIFYEIHCIEIHALESALPLVHVLAVRLIYLAVSVHSWCLDVSRCRAVQFGRSFVPACVQLWNSLDEPCFAGDGVVAFKSQINRAFLWCISNSFLHYSFQ